MTSVICKSTLTLNSHLLSIAWTFLHQWKTYNCTVFLGVCVSTGGRRVPQPGPGPRYPLFSPSPLPRHEPGQGLSPPHPASPPPNRQEMPRTQYGMTGGLSCFLEINWSLKVHRAHRKRIVKTDKNTNSIFSVKFRSMSRSTTSITIKINY